MKTKLIIILLIMFFNHSYSQEFDETKLDSKLQIKYKDTLQNIGKRLTGKWKYLGKRNNGILIDTLFASFLDEKKTYGIVENGITYEIVNGKRKKANYYYEITYSFKNVKGFYSRNKKYLDENFMENSTCQPIPKLIYFESNLGILFIGMAGQSFKEISELTTEKLVLGNGKEYLKIE